MGEMINQYELLAPFQNKDAGFSRWTYAVRKGRTYFLKEFLSPVYPSGDVLSEAMRNSRIRACTEFEQRNKKLYEKVNRISDGNLVRIHEFFRHDSHYYISMERIEDEKIDMEALQKTSFRDRLLLCLTVSHGILRLHDAHIVHADIKDSNILIKKSRNGRLVGKIIDYEACFFENESFYESEELEGDQLYLAPESCRFIFGEDVKLTTKIDVFALGLLFHQYLTGKFPDFDKTEYAYAFEAVLDGKKLSADKDLPLDLQQIINRMLKKDPEERVTMEKVHLVLENALCHGTGTFGVRGKPIQWDEKEDDDVASWLKPAGDL